MCGVGMGGRYCVVESCEGNENVFLLLVYNCNLTVVTFLKRFFGFVV